MNTSYYLSYHFVFRTHYLSVTMDCGYEFYNLSALITKMLCICYKVVSLVVQTNLSPHILPGTRDSNLYP